MGVGWERVEGGRVGVMGGAVCERKGKTVLLQVIWQFRPCTLRWGSVLGGDNQLLAGGIRQA